MGRDNLEYYLETVNNYSLEKFNQRYKTLLNMVAINLFSQEEIK